MLQVDEQRPGAIRVVLRDAAGDVLAEAAKEVNILACESVEGDAASTRARNVGCHVQPNSRSHRST